ncbi:MAG: phosphate acyltransferase PlsX [Alphaproteobacteria bacterium]|nr:phosphate acyltransferase PlsX [Alphaproteobacteria bacterium]
MSQPPVIALDAMGGDRSPEMAIEGTALAARRHPGTRFLLHGDRARLEPLVAAKTALAGAVEIVHSDQVIVGDEKPSQALRRGRGSSMGMAIESVREGRAQGAVSAGNTGALMALAMFQLKTLPEIDRPAIVSVMPTKIGSISCMLDLGANVQCDADNLVQFAIMGAAFARVVIGIARPRVGLLNVGSEDLKGHDEVRLAAQLLRERALPFEFLGFVEGDAILSGEVDVTVTDGFTGNIALKAMEGAVKMVTGLLRTNLSATWRARGGYLLARPAFDRVRDTVDPRRYNGAMFLGLNGIVVKSHGGTDEIGFANAIRVAIELAENRIGDRIIADMRGLKSEQPTAAGAR